jgi:hypothetical protein
LNPTHLPVSSTFYLPGCLCLAVKLAITARDVEQTLKLGTHYREEINAAESLHLRVVGEPYFIKAPRSAATRYDKVAAKYLTFISLASIRIWLRA